MSLIPRFVRYAAAFEEAYASNDWSLVEPYFTEDAVYEISGMPAPIGGRMEGRDAILAYFERVLDGFDRRFESRAVALVEGPREEAGSVWLRGSVVYTAPGVPDLRFELEETAVFEGDRIRRLEDRYDDETIRAVATYADAHGKTLGLDGAVDGNTRKRRTMNTSDPTRRFLSEKPIPPQERLIFALDVPSYDEARDLIRDLGDSVHFYKLGLELFMAGNYFEIVEELVGRGKKIFVDLKFFDVPETVRSAVRQLKHRGAYFATVHGNDAILEAACQKRGDLKILAVTALTSLDEADLRDLGFQCNVEELVLSRARRALEIGCDGVISSGLEARALRSELGQRFLIVSPGIRPVENRPTDDQKRVVSVEDAFLSGADYIVVGRPIRRAGNPKAATMEIQATIASLFS